MLQQVSEPFCWFQCPICGRIFDSERAHRVHEEECRKLEAFFYSSKRSTDSEDPPAV
ncbi:MAG: DUF7128 family protein [Terriglobia bacterium]